MLRDHGVISKPFQTSFKHCHTTPHKQSSLLESLESGFKNVEREASTCVQERLKRVKCSKISEIRPWVLIPVIILQVFPGFLNPEWSNSLVFFCAHMRTDPKGWYPSSYHRWSDFAVDYAGYDSIKMGRSIFLSVLSSATTVVCRFWRRRQRGRPLRIPQLADTFSIR